MEHVVGKLTIYRIECPYCGDDVLRFAHNVTRHWRCLECGSEVIMNDELYDEEVSVTIDLCLGDEITVYSITEEYD